MKRNPGITGEFVKGLWQNNPVFCQLLGMCPTLAVTGKALQGLTMGLAVTFVLVSTGIVISLIRKVVPRQVRIVTFTVTIATFVTLADRFLAACFPAMSASLGPYVPLIVVNCIILGRQEAFTSKNPLLPSLLDALGMSVGFTWALVVLGCVREVLAYGSIFGQSVLGTSFEPWVVMALPPGAFITLGLLIGLMNVIQKKREARMPACHLPAGSKE